MKLSTLIGKRILTETGEETGYVKGVLLTKKFALSHLVCADGDEREFYLPARAILACHDAVTALNVRAKRASGMNLPLGKPVYDKNGIFVGTVQEAETDRDGTAFLLCNEKTERTVAGAQLVFGDVGILREIREQKKTAPKTESGQERRTQEANGKVKSGFGADLLGKTVRRAVSSDGKILIPAGETITPSVIQRASEKNKLLELMKNTLT